VAAEGGDHHKVRSIDPLGRFLHDQCACGVSKAAQDTSNRGPCSLARCLISLSLSPSLPLSIRFPPPFHEVFLPSLIKLSFPSFSPLGLSRVPPCQCPQRWRRRLRSSSWKGGPSCDAWGEVEALLEHARERWAPCLLPAVAGHTAGGAGQLLLHRGSR
jgi:hypothetical protein